METSDLPQELQGIYRALNQFHESCEDDLTVADLANLFFASSPPDRDFYITLFENLEKLEVSESSTKELITALRRNRVLQEISLKSYEATQGKGSFSDVVELTKQLEDIDEIPEEEENPFVTSDLAELLEKTYSKPGLRWRLKVLNQMLGSLRLGNFGFIFARPETGKTTFLADQLTFMASQTDKPILWINNEEQGDNVMLRVYQSALGINLVDLKRDWESNYKRYLDLTGDRIKLYDNANTHKAEVEKLCEKYQPALVVFDQLDKIQGFKADREDLLLGSIYIWARELAKKYCPVIGVTQADGTGEGVRYLTMANVSNAKTAKQAEADWILGIGKDNNPGLDTLRFLHLSKNKLLGDEDSIPAKRHGREQVEFRPDIARYLDIERNI